MRSLLAIIHESFLRLRRDKVFMPTIVFGVICALFSLLISDWSLESIKKVLFDFGALGFELTGVAIAIFWGTKSISDSQGEGSLEVQLASPISRSTWLLGKYFGLVLGLSIIAIILVLFWQLILAYYGYPRFVVKELWVFLLITVEWFVVGAIAMFFASMASPTIALFSSVLAWVCGLLSAVVAASLSPETDAHVKIVISKIALFWDLSRFHIVDAVNRDLEITSNDVYLRCLYGVFLIGLLLSTSCLIFRNRDLAA